MRILHLLGNDVLNPNGGLGVAVDEITKALCKKDVQNSISGYDGSNCSYASHFDGREIVRAQLDHQGQIFGDMKYHQQVHGGMMRTLASHFRQHQFDLIHLHDTINWPVADIARRWFNCPVILTMHLSFGVENCFWPGWNEVSNFDLQNEITALMESRLTFVSRAYAAEVIGHYNLDIAKPAETFSYIPNGIDCAAIDAEPAVDITDLCKGRKAVYFCGRMVRTKGVELLIEAAKALPDHQFLIFANTPPNHEDMEPLARHMKAAEYLYDNITWFKNFPLRKQFGYLKSCEMALVPSINKAPFEITGLEAMAARTPLITTAICGMRDYCSLDNCDIHVPTIEGLVKAIKEHQRDDNKILQARKTAEKFTWDAAAEGYLTFYKEVLCQG